MSGGRGSAHGISGHLSVFLCRELFFFVVAVVVSFF